MKMVNEGKAFQWLDAILTLEYTGGIHTKRGLDILKCMEIRISSYLSNIDFNRNMYRAVFRTEKLIQKLIKMEKEKHDNT